MPTFKVTGGPALRGDNISKGKNTIRCYSGGKCVKTVNLSGYEYEPDDGGFSLVDKNGECVFIWSGTYSVIHSSFKG